MNATKLMVTGLFLLLFSTFAIASGAHSAEPGSMKMSDYNKGKMIVHKHLMCDSCPLKDTKLDKELAQDIMAKLSQGDTSIGSFEKGEVSSVSSYLQERFSL